MGRKPRLEYPGGVYHIIQRGNNREYIFGNDHDKRFIIDLIKEYRDKLKFDLYGYVIMSNHYHLILKLSDVPLQDIMHRINNKYSRNFNKTYNRTGHVFENRYKGILVIDDKYLLSLLRYVHQNPVLARMCKWVSDYPWSSDRLYRLNNKSNGIVNIDFILDIFTKDRVDAIKSYIDFMDENKKEDIGVFEDADVIGAVNTRVIDEYIKSDTKSLDKILKDVTEDETLYNNIKEGSRKRNLSRYKKEFIDIAIKSGYTMEEIGKSISISATAIFKIHNAQ
ncbi:MAG: transposase [Tissierellia bacterium]|nr:transposase [Tissierellia bacterium]